MTKAISKRQCANLLDYFKKEQTKSREDPSKPLKSTKYSEKLSYDLPWKTALYTSKVIETTKEKVRHCMGYDWEESEVEKEVIQYPKGTSELIDDIDEYCVLIRKDVEEYGVAPLPKSRLLKHKFLESEDILEIYGAIIDTINDLSNANPDGKYAKKFIDVLNKHV